MNMFIGCGLVPDVAHDVLDAGVVLKAIHRKVFSVTGVTETTVWHLGSKWNVGVDPNATEVQALAKAHCGGVIRGPNARSKSILHVVGVSHCLIGILELLNGDDRTKDFVLDVLVFLL